MTSQPQVKYSIICGLSCWGVWTGPTQRWIRMFFARKNEKILQSQKEPNGLVLAQKMSAVIKSTGASTKYLFRGVQFILQSLFVFFTPQNIFCFYTFIIQNIIILLSQQNFTIQVETFLIWFVLVSSSYITKTCHFHGRV